jgi:hypothetical protein
VTGVCFSKELPKTKSNGVLPPSHVGGTQNQNTSSSFASEPVAPEFAVPMTKWKQNQESVESYRHQPSFSSHHELPKTKPNGVLPPSHMGGTQNQNTSSSFASEPVAPEFAEHMTKWKQNQESVESYRHQPSLSSQHELHSPAPSSDVGSCFLKGDTSVSRNDLYALVPHEPSHGLGSVLEALKQARVSLKQKMNQVPLIEGASVGKAVEPSVPATNTGNLMEIPVGCAGLFRLPTDFLLEAGTQADFLGSGSGTTNYYPNQGVAVTAGDRLGNGPYLETRSGISTSDQYLPSRYSKTLSRVYTEKPQFDAYWDTIKSSSSRYTNPTYPTYPAHAAYPSYRSYPEFQPQMPSNEGFPQSFSSRAVGVPPADNYFYDDRIRPNMYR